MLDLYTLIAQCELDTHFALKPELFQETELSDGRSQSAVLSAGFYIFNVNCFSSLRSF